MFAIDIQAQLLYQVVCHDDVVFMVRTIKRKNHMYLKYPGNWDLVPVLGRATGTRYRTEIQTIQGQK